MIRGSFESLKPVDETYNSRYRYFRHVLLVTRSSIFMQKFIKSSSIIMQFNSIEIKFVYYLEIHFSVHSLLCIWKARTCYRSTESITPLAFAE